MKSYFFVCPFKGWTFGVLSLRTPCLLPVPEDFLLFFFVFFLKVLYFTFAFATVTFTQSDNPSDEETLA